VSRIDYGTESRPGRGKFLWTITAILVAIACLYAGWRGLLRAMDPEIVRNAADARATKLADLPAGATNISYYRGGTFDPVPASFECDVEVESFRAWAKAHDWPLEERAGSIRRFDNSTADIDRGLFYQWTQEDTGRYAAYDLDHGRAYFHQHTR
jgi:hypothetical protein